MPTVSSVQAALDRWYPPQTAESWDAVGLTCGDPEAKVRRVLLAVDCVPVTVGEAASFGAELLITHHPLLLTGVHSVALPDPKGSMVHRMIAGAMAHLVAHTNADIAVGGVSAVLAQRLGLTAAVALEPPGAAVGTGRIGDLAAPTTLRAFLDHVGRVLPSTVWGVRASGHPDQPVRRVAVCGGSGGGYADLARAQGADVYVTSDLKHHSTLEAVAERTNALLSGPVADGIARTGPPMALVDAAHWATERPWLDVLAADLRAEFGSSLSVIVSSHVTDPWTLHAC